MNTAAPRGLRAFGVVVAVATAVVMLLGFRWHEDQAALVEDMQTQAALIGSVASAALVFDDAATANDIIVNLRRSPDVLEAVVYRGNGTRLAEFSRSAAVSALPPLAPPSGHAFAHGGLTVAVPVQVGERAVGSIALRTTLDRVYREVGHFALGVIGITAVALLVGVFFSRSARRRIDAAERALEEVALVDRLTGLANRQAFEQALEAALGRHRENGGCALLMLDLDGFKKVNDLLGHQQGDQLLCAVADRLRGALRGADVIARIGGDQFAAILTDTAAAEDAARVAAKLIAIGAQPFALSGGLAHVGFSIGVALIPRDGDAVGPLMQRAELAMYQAKQAGKGRYLFFSEDLGEVMRQRLELEGALRQAIDHRELHVVYQPQVKAAGGAVVGLEALVRWRRPQYGLVSPGEFIPLAEETGLIIDLGRYVIGRVCDDICMLRTAGLTVPRVAVNISSRQLMHEDFSAELTALLSIGGLRAEDVELELTESVLMDRLESCRDILDELSAQQFTIAIDDFGTGYSSLSYLHQLPVDTLKIDMSFVRRLPDDADSLAIVRGIIGMAHAMNMQVVAEGVEHAGQLECLRELGCDLIQGYLTGRPLELEALTERLSRW